VYFSVILPKYFTQLTANSKSANSEVIGDIAKYDKVISEIYEREFIDKIFDEFSAIVSKEKFLEAFEDSLFSYGHNECGVNWLF